jgi:hypothetical protein
VDSAAAARGFDHGCGWIFWRNGAGGGRRQRGSVGRFPAIPHPKTASAGVLAGGGHLDFSPSIIAANSSKK